MARPTMNRRWCCPTCSKTFSGRFKPDHEHLLERLCPYPDCRSTLQKGRPCSEEHALLALRLARGLGDTLQARAARSGLALFQQRRRLGLTRRTLTQRLRCPKSKIYLVELYDREVPADWMPSLRELGLFPEPRVEPRCEPPHPPPKPAASAAEGLTVTGVRLAEGLVLFPASDGLQLHASWPVLESAGRWLGRAISNILLAPPVKIQVDPGSMPKR